MPPTVNAVVAADDLTKLLLRARAFVLTQIVGCSYDEAAEICGCPVGTIRSRVAQARADLVEVVRRAEAT